MTVIVVSPLRPEMRYHHIDWVHLVVYHMHLCNRSYTVSLPGLSRFSLLLFLYVLLPPEVILNASSFSITILWSAWPRGLGHVPFLFTPLGSSVQKYALDYVDTVMCFLFL